MVKYKEWCRPEVRDSGEKWGREEERKEGKHEKRK